MKSSSPSKSKRAYLILGIVTLVVLASYFAYGLITGNQASTDNAQLEADIVPLASKVGGTLLHLHVKDNQTVKKGDLIAEIDPRDATIRVAQLAADLEAARAQAETSSSKNGNAAQVAAARAALSRADTDFHKAETDFARSQNLKTQNAISAVEFENAQNLVDRFRAARDQANAQLKVAEEQHGFATAKVKSAEAAAEQAEAQLEYTRIYAPRDGILSKIAVQEGQIVAAGQTITLLVDRQSFVVANFKETQIGRMQIGQKAEISVDAFPGHPIQGKVESLAAATGARFSLLPPDNASGNFVKVVQRVPVRIQLEGKEAQELALKAGLSAEVTVYLK